LHIAEASSPLTCGWFSGLRREAVEAAVERIFECVLRKVSEEQLTRHEILEHSLYLEPDELQQALSKLGWTLHAAQVTSMLDKFDENNDGRIDKAEMQQLLLWLKKGTGGGFRDHEDFGGGPEAITSEIGMIRQENGVPTRDAFWIIPVPEAAYAKMLVVRNQIHLLKEFDARLRSIESGRNSSADLLEAAEAALDARPSDEAVLDTVADFHEGVVGVVRHLLLDITQDDNEDVLSREGIPNKLTQKLLRECHGIEVVMSVLRELFKSVNPDEVDADRYSKVKEVAVILYRLMKQSVKDNITNSMRLLPFLSIIASHLGKGLSAMQVLEGFRFRVQGSGFRV
jgi:hypothetical protein